MQNSTVLASSPLLNRLTTIKLALALLAREPLLTTKQRALVQLARDATADVVTELPRA